MRTFRILPLTGLAALAAVAAAQLLSSQAEALAVVANPVIPPTGLFPGAEAVSVEGKVTAFDAAARTLTIDNGTVITFPADPFKIDTTGDAVGDILFSQLVNTLPSPIGGVVIADALATGAPNSPAVFTVTAAYFEFGEHVIVGPLIKVDAATGTFQIAGTTIKAATDTRFNPAFLDLGGNSLGTGNAAIAALAGWEGSLASAQGYMKDGVLYATLVETNIIQALPTDSVVIERALYTPSKRALDIKGSVTKYPGTVNIGDTDRFANTVQVAVSTTTGTVNLGFATVIPDLALNVGTYRLKTANNVVPANFTGTVFVTSVFPNAPLGTPVGSANKVATQ